MSHLLNSPAFTGVPTAPTAGTGDNSTQLATTAFVKSLGYSTGAGTVTAIGVTTANGVSGSSSGGATPNLTISLGAITPTTVNGLTFVAATTGFTVAGGTTSKTLTVSNTLTLAGTDTSTLNIGTGGTLGTAAFTAASAYATAAQTFYIGTSSVAINAGTGTFTTIAGMTSITSTTFVGALTGNASSATNIAGGTANQIAYQTGAGATSFYSASNYGLQIYGATGTPASIAGAAGVLQGSASAIPAFTTTPTLTGTNFTGIPESAVTNLTSDLSGKASTSQTMYIGTTSVAINRTTGALTLAGVTIDDTTTNIGTSAATTVNLGTGSTVNTVNIGTGTGVSQINIGGAGDTVTIAGTLNTVSTTNTTIADTLLTLNKGGAVSSGAAVGIEVEENATITGYIKTTGDRTGWVHKAPANSGTVTLTGPTTAYDASFVFGALGAARAYSFPDAGGTVALTSDIHAPVTISTANGLSLSTQALSLAAASTSVTGALTSTDWNTFNGKAAANQTMYIGTTSVAINRASAALVLTGITSIDGSAATVANAVTFNNGGAGDASGTTFNGSAARTISYNTLGAQAALSGTGFVKSTAGTISYDTNTYLTTSTASSTYAPLASPTFTGTPTLPTGTIATTQSAGNSSTAVATTAFVAAAIAIEIQAIATKTTTYTATGTDSVLLADATSGAFTITLPAAPTTGQVFNIKKIDSSANAVTVSGNSKTIDGSSSISVAAQWNSYTMVYNGTSWYLI